MRTYRRTISRGYRLLSILNTIGVLLSGNPSKIAKHFIRKRIVRKARRII